MTVLDDPPVAHAPVSLPIETHRSSPVSRWRLAARLARREVRRRPGRTLLVTLLVAVPVLGMTVASVIAHSQADPWAERFERVAGQADVRLQLWAGGNPQIATTSAEASVADDELLGRLLPAGSTWERYHHTWAPIRSASASRYVEITDLDVTSPLLAGVAEVRAGRAARGAAEVALDAGTARHFGVGIGDTLTLTSPQGSWSVVGLVRSSDNFRSSLVVFGAFDWSHVRADAQGELVFIDVPDGTTPAGTEALVRDLEPYAQVDARDVPPYESEDREISGQALAWGWVVGALALCVLGIIIAAAFATSARRQLVTLGQLSANGADQRLLRRTLALQGSWSGLIGSVTGIVGGLVALVFARGLAEHIIGRNLGPYEFVGRELIAILVTGVVAATIAALVPARSAAKVPVMAALAGRRPLATPSRRLVPIGLALFGGGLFMLVLVAVGVRDGAADNGVASNGDLYAGVAILGGLGVLFGMCCATPLAVDTVGRLGGRVSGSWKLSGRSLARTRSRSAGVVTAIAAAGAFAVAGSTLVASVNAERHSEGITIPPLPADTVVLRGASFVLEPAPAPGTESPIYDPPKYTPVPVPADVLQKVLAITGGTVSTRRAAVWDPAPYDTSGEFLPGKVRADLSGVMVVADPIVLDLVGLSAADRATLDEVGSMALSTLIRPPGLESPEPAGPVTLDIEGRAPITFDVATPADSIASWGGVDSERLITVAKAEELGLEIVEDGLVIRADHALTDRQVRAVTEVDFGDYGQEIFIDPSAPAPGPDAAFTSVSYVLPYYPSREIPTGLIQFAIAVTALLFTLFIVAIGLALSAVESRDERDVLIAVGAKPRTMRRVAGQKAALLSLAGTVLAVPTGLLPVVTVLRALRIGDGSDTPIVVPWLMLVVLVAGVTIVAGVVTWAGSAVAQRVRPMSMSTLHDY